MAFLRPKDPMRVAKNEPFICKSNIILKERSSSYDNRTNDIAYQSVPFTMRPSKILQLLISSLALLNKEAKGAVQVLANDANEIAVDLEAFQILYTTTEGYACSMDQFRLVAATRQHMISLLGRDPNFAGLKLQHTLHNSISSGPIFKNGTKAVFIGRAIYNATAPSADSMRNMENLCFLGENQTAYEDSLRQQGCTTLDQAHLMTNAGEGVVLSVDDNEDNVGSSASENPPSSDHVSESEDDDSKANIALITVIALLVPVSLLLLLVMLWLVRQQVNRINWEVKSDKDPYWRTDHPLAQERFKVINGFEPEVLESSRCISTDDSAGSSTAVEEQRQRYSPQRQRRSKLEIEQASSRSGQDDDDDESDEICSNTSITVHV